MSTTKQDLVDFFYCDSGWWGGWNRFFKPSIPSRLFDSGFRVIRDAIQCQEKAQDAITFLSSTHTKYLRQAGKGECDVECCPTPEARKAVELLLDYSQSLPANAP